MPFRHAMILLVVLGISCSLAAVGSSLAASRYDKSANLNSIPLKFAATHVSRILHNY
jgi:hypothetical protein